jgi:selenocysteine lyase/cysteine desulfurase
VINLEHGYFGLQATPVFDAWQNIEKQIHNENSFFLRNRLPGRLAAVKQELAEFVGCELGELLITRNVIEALNIAIQGYPFSAGDEIVVATHDYDAVIDTIKMIGVRKCVSVRFVTIPLDPECDESIVELYQRAIGSKTRVILLTHLVHRTGQIMPVAKIAAMARARGVDSIVDAASSFAQIDFNVSDLAADFVGVNLHKWLGAPLGLGMLYIRKPRISDMAPLFGDVAHAIDDIAKLGNFGTVPPGPVLTIPAAIAFHRQIGATNKEARLRYLTQYWLSRVRQLPNVTVLTPSAPHRSCAIASFRIDGISSSDIVRRLFDEHRIFTVVRQVDGDACVRVTPHLHTSTSELDLLVGALTILATENAVSRP